MKSNLNPSGLKTKYYKHFKIIFFSIVNSKNKMCFLISSDIFCFMNTKLKMCLEVSKFILTKKQNMFSKLS